MVLDKGTRSEKVTTRLYIHVEIQICTVLFVYLYCRHVDGIDIQIL